jgi:hypothetical protein
MKPRGARDADNRVVYGISCVWWDGIEKVGKTPLRGGVSLPCCPQCGGVLMQVDGPKQWWDAVEKHEASGHPGYRAFIEWLKGKCFPTMQAAQEIYETKPGRTVKL